jgi:hypothetical protein
MSDQAPVPVPVPVPVALRELIEKESRAYDGLVREGEIEKAYAALQNAMTAQSPSLSTPVTPNRNTRSFKRWHMSLVAAVIAFGILSAIFVLCGSPSTKAPTIAAEAHDARSIVTQANATTAEPTATWAMPRVSSGVPESSSSSRRRVPQRNPLPVGTGAAPNASAAGTQAPPR